MTKFFGLRLTFIFLSIALCYNTYASNCIKGPIEEVRITSNAFYAETRMDAELPISEIESLKWNRISKFGFGKPANAFDSWIKIELCEMQERDYYLYLKANSSNEINIYLKEGSQEIHLHQEFIHRTNSDKVSKYFNPTSIIPVKQDQDLTIYIHSKDKGGNIKLPIYILTKANFIKKNQGEEIRSGVIYGFLLLMILCTIFLGIKWKSLAYFYYLMILFSDLLIIGTTTGHFFKHFFSYSSDLNDTAGFFAFLLKFIFFIALTSTVLDLRNTHKYINRFLIGLMIFWILVFTVGSIPFNLYDNLDLSLFLKVTQVLVPSYPFIIILTCLYIYIKDKTPSALYLALGFTFSGFLILINVLMSYNLASVYLIETIVWFPVFEAIIILSLLLLDYLKSKKETQQLLNDIINAKTQTMVKMDSARRNERKKISNFLHDIVGLKLGALKMLSKQDQFKLIEYNELLNETSNDIRNMSHILNPLTMQNEDLSKLIENVIYQIESVNDKIIIEFSAKGDLGSLSLNIKETYYLGFIEILQNILKHSDANEVSISLQNINAQLVLSIEDNGKVFFPHDDTEGLGLKSIRNEMEILNGKLHIQERKLGAGMLHEFRLNTQTTNELVLL